MNIFVVVRSLRVHRGRKDFIQKNMDREGEKRPWTARETRKNIYTLVVY